MELNAEQIKKALKDLMYEAYATNGAHKPYLTMRDALTLINSQEQRIKELTEENEAWQKSLITQKENADKAYYKLACEVENLRVDNERLKNENI